MQGQHASVSLPASAQATAQAQGGQEPEGSCGQCKGHASMARPGQCSELSQLQCACSRTSAQPPSRQVRVDCRGHALQLHAACRPPLTCCSRSVVYCCLRCRDLAALSLFLTWAPHCCVSPGAVCVCVSVKAARCTQLAVMSQLPSQSNPAWRICALPHASAGLGWCQSSPGCLPHSPAGLMDRAGCTTRRLHGTPAAAKRPLGPQSLPNPLSPMAADSPSLQEGRCSPCASGHGRWLHPPLRPPCACVAAWA